MRGGIGLRRGGGRFKGMLVLTLLDQMNGIEIRCRDMGDAW